MSLRAGLPLRFDLSGIGVRVSGAPAEVADRLRSEWARFVPAGDDASPPFLDVEVVPADLPAPAGAFAPKAMRAELSTGEARYVLPEGEAVAPLSGAVRIALGTRVEPVRSYYALANLIRASLAWRLPSRPAALLHAAGLVIDGSAFLLVGSEGSGKSTWAAAGERAGGRVLSDDLVLVDGAVERFEVLGAPFRSTHRDTCGPGRWPLAAILFPLHGRVPALSAVAPIVARGRIVAALPFVAEAMESDPRVLGLVNALAGSVPARVLTFEPSASFVDLLRALPPPPGRSS